jgi:hypothetical protein
MWKELQYLIGQGAGGNIVIFRLPPHQYIAHTTACPEGGVSGLLEPCGYFAGIGL